MKLRIVVTALLVLLLTGLAGAENRALLIGIGQGYRAYNINPIKGPEKDVDLARGLAEKLGFEKSQMRILREEEATSKAIKEGLSWVEEGVRGGGKALFYYSGHGTQIASGSGEGCQELLVPVDSTSNEKLINFAEIRKFLNAIKSAEVVFIIDACFSGTITKSVYNWSAENIKYLDKGAKCGQAVNVKSFAVVTDIKGDSRIVGMAATASNEVAYGDLTGSGKGSIFTQALADIVNEKGLKVTFRNIRDEAAGRVRAISERYNMIPHTPQLGGNTALFSAYLDLNVSNEAYTGGVDNANNNREVIERIVNNSKFMVAMRADKKRLALGENINFSVISSRDGYLNIIEVEPNGNLNVIFPNKVATDNRVSADREKLVPQDIGGFKFKAQEPQGESIIAALVTDTPVNLFEDKSLGSSLGNFRSIDGSEHKKFKNKLMRSLGVEYGKTESGLYGAQKITIEVRK